MKLYLVVILVACLESRVYFSICMDFKMQTASLRPQANGWDLIRIVEWHSWWEINDKTDLLAEFELGSMQS